MDPLKSAKSNADKIQELRDELDRLKGIIFASQGIGGKLLDQDVTTNRSPSDQTSIAPPNSD